MPNALSPIRDLLRTNLHSSPTFRSDLPQSYRPIHHLHHLQLVAATMPTVRNWWNRLYEESEVLEEARGISNLYTAIRFARIYDQAQIDGFIAEMKTYAARLGHLRSHLSNQPCGYQGALMYTLH